MNETDEKIQETTEEAEAPETETEEAGHSSLSKSDQPAAAEAQPNKPQLSPEERTKLARNVVPKDASEYGNHFKPDEKYSAAAADTESDKGKFLQGTIANLDKIALANGLTINQANAIKSQMFGLLEDVGILDTRTAEAKSAAILEQQRKVLGDHAADIIKTNVDFLDKFGVFSQSERDLLKLAATEGNPLIVSVIDKIRWMHGKGNSADIPHSAASDGLPPDDRWLEDYKKATPAEKLRMVKTRADAGRSPNLSIG